MAETNWYEDMATAMKKRDRALMYIGNWKNVLQQAEAQIQELAAAQQAPVLQEPALGTMNTTEPA